MGREPLAARARCVFEVLALESERVGLALQHLGFSGAFLGYALLASAGALLFVLRMPETRRAPGL